MSIRARLLNETDKLPIWFMRQAGRYLCDYRKVRKQYSNFLDFCYSVDDAAIVTMQPLDIFDLDAAIIFSDILVIPDMLGLKVVFEEEKGPIVDLSKSKLKDKMDTNKIKTITSAISKTKILMSNSKHKNKDLIGFVGAPFTLCYYVFETVPSNRANTIINICNNNTQLIDTYIELFIKNCYLLLEAQIQAGATVVKIFESWADLIADDIQLFKKYCFEPIKAIVKKINKKYPEIFIIVFPKTSSQNILLFNSLAIYNVVIALSSEQDLNWCYANLNTPLQGNIRNTIFFEEKEVIDKEINSFMDIISGKPHICNLGHGILKETDPKKVEYVIKKIRSYEYKQRRFNL